MHEAHGRYPAYMSLVKTITLIYHFPPKFALYTTCRLAVSLMLAKRNLEVY